MLSLDNCAYLNTVLACSNIFKQPYLEQTDQIQTNMHPYMQRKFKNSMFIKTLLKYYPQIFIYNKLMAWQYFRDLNQVFMTLQEYPSTMRLENVSPDMLEDIQRYLSKSTHPEIHHLSYKPKHRVLNHGFSMLPN